jgi:predicted DNA-binding WGR domain protein
VLGKWGKRDCRTTQVQVKGEWDTEAEASRQMESLFREKLKKGYEDIFSDDYSGTVAFDSMQKHMEEDPAVAKTDTPVKSWKEEEDEATKKKDERSNEGGRVLRVKCIDNLYREHLFLLGEVYNAETIENDPEFLMVTALTGEVVEASTERFREVR